VLAVKSSNTSGEAALTFVDLPDLVRRDLALLARQVLRLVAVDQLLDARLEGVRVLRLRNALLRSAASLLRTQDSMAGFALMGCSGPSQRFDYDAAGFKKYFSSSITASYAWQHHDIRADSMLPILCCRYMLAF